MDLIFILAAALTAGPVVTSISIEHGDEGERTTTELSLDQKLPQIWIELGEPIGSQVIHVRTEPVDAEIVVEQQAETSLTVANEGPHLDLLDWKHGYSGWRTLTKGKDGSYRPIEPTVAERSRFPKVTVAEIVAAVRARGGERWAVVAENVTSVTDYPVSVALSRVIIRVKVKDGDGWRTLQLFALLNPMGC